MQLHRSQMITLARGRFGSAASLVLEHVRDQGTATRDDLARVVAGSPATVNRHVGSLVTAGLLRERPDLVPAGDGGRGGRPGLPLEIDPDHFVVVGVHLGRRVDTVAVADLAGRVLGHRLLAREEGHAPGALASSDLDSLGRAVAELVAERPGARPLAAGLVAPWLDLGLDVDATEHALRDLLGLEVATADHIAAVAAAEFLHRRTGTPGVTLYVYARDTVGHAIAVDKGFQTEISRVGTMTHFPTGSRVRCGCGHRGCLEATVCDYALVTRARRAGLIGADEGITTLFAAGADGDDRAHDLLVERGRVLGEAAAIMRDVARPDRVVLVGQAFTGYPHALPDVRAAFEERTALGPVDLHVTRFGSGIQAIAASTIALGPVYDDPLGVVPAPRLRESEADPGCAEGRPA